jgi:hypothetical protein
MPTYRLTATLLGAAAIALLSAGVPQAAPPRQTPVEMVWPDTATGDGGNAWGGHQTRVVRTAEGVFTAYTVESEGPFLRQWRLVRRQDDGTWTVIALGGAGKDPVNLLASPAGTLYVIGWPGGVGTLWTIRPSDTPVTTTTTGIPQVARGHWPYASAGIDADGNLCVLSSSGGETRGGTFDWACYLPIRGQWLTRSSALDFRHAYTYVFPDPILQLSLVSTRDVRWEALGHQKPPGAFDYAFNAFQYWRTRDLRSLPIQSFSSAEERPTAAHPAPYLNAQMDAYVDTQDRMHILYWRSGATTGGTTERRHRIVAPSGALLHDDVLPQDAGWFSRIFQDDEERFYILGSAGMLYTLDRDGMSVVERTPLDLGGFSVEYSGPAVSVPRTGTPRGDVMDVVFPSGNGRQWLYFQLDLRGEAP